MINEYNYVSIKEILRRLMNHPLLQDITLEQVIQYTIDFIGVFGYPKLYEDKETELHVEEYRTLLPCDLVSINQVKDKKTNVYLRSMTNTFREDKSDEYAFKTQGQVLYTSFKNGDVLISYKSIPLDDDGFPLLIDNPVYLRTLEAYIKKEVFTILFDMNKINGNAFTNAQQDYAWKAGQCNEEFNIPSISEMESLTNMWTTLLQRTKEFKSGFINLGTTENYKTH